MRVLVYGIDLAGKFLSHLHMGYIARKYKNFLKDNGFDVITLGITPRADIVLRVGESISSVLLRLPIHWEPEFILVQGPEYLFLPTDIIRTPYPLVFATCDFDYEIARSFEFLYSSADCVVCYSSDTESIMKEIGVRKTIKFPIWFGSENLPLPSEIKEPKMRSIDVFYSGNIDPISLPEKGRLLCELSKIKGRKVEVFPNYLPYDKYSQKLLDSRVAVIYHRRREVQRIEAIFHGAVLVTNSPEFREMFRENEDFFFYNDFDEFTSTVEKAIDFVLSQNYRHSERVERISALREKAHSKMRFLELLRKISENIDEIRSNAEQRKKNIYLYVENAMKTNYFSFFELLDIFGISRQTRQNTLRMLKESPDFPSLPDNLKLLVDYSSIFFGSQNIHEIKQEIKNYIYQGRDSDFITPLNAAVFETLFFNLLEALPLLETALARLKKFEQMIIADIKEELRGEILGNSFFLISSVLSRYSRHYIYFPEFRNILLSWLRSFKNLDNSDPEEIKKEIYSGITQLEAYIVFLKSIILRDISWDRRKVKMALDGIEYAIRKHRRWVYLSERAKTYIKLGDTKKAFEDVLELSGMTVNFDVSELLLMSMLSGKIQKKDESNILEKIKLGYLSSPQSDPDVVDKFFRYILNTDKSVDSQDFVNKIISGTVKPRVIIPIAHGEEKFAFVSALSLMHSPIQLSVTVVTDGDKDLIKNIMGNFLYGFEILGGKNVLEAVKNILSSDIENIFIIMPSCAFIRGMKFLIDSALGFLDIPILSLSQDGVKMIAGRGGVISNYLSSKGEFIVYPAPAGETMNVPKYNFE